MGEQWIIYGGIVEHLMVEQYNIWKWNSDIKCVTSLPCGPWADLWPFFGLYCKWFSLYWFIPLNRWVNLLDRRPLWKEKLSAALFLLCSSRWRYWVSVNRARENPPTKPSSGLLESEPSGRKSEASGKSATVPFGRISAAFDYLNTQVPTCGKIWLNNISHRNPCHGFCI